jgi:hypothetical protein
MYYGIKPGIAYCVTGATVILLDIEESRYFALPESTAKAFIRLLHRQGELIQDDEICLADLLIKGYLMPVPGPRQMAFDADIEPSHIDGRSLGSGHVPISYMLLAIWHQMTSVIRLQTVNFRDVLARIRARSPVQTLSEEDCDRRAWLLAKAFERTSVVFGRTDRCLVRSIAMMAACHRLGIPAQFIIGVRSDPFVAHSWIQRRDITLNDTVEHVRNFTPILVVR